MTVFKTFKEFDARGIALKPTLEQTEKAKRAEAKRIEREGIRIAERERAEAEEKRILEEAIKRVKADEQALKNKLADELKAHLSGEEALNSLIVEQEFQALVTRQEQERLELEAKQEKRRQEQARLEKIRYDKLERQFALERAERKLREIEEFAIRTNTTVYTPIKTRKIKFD